MPRDKEMKSIALCCSKFALTEIVFLTHKSVVSQSFEAISFVVPLSGCHHAKWVRVTSWKVWQQSKELSTFQLLLDLFICNKEQGDTWSNV
jgi:hypothetical protein